MTVIYGLRAPDDDTIRYVGQTSQPKKRLAGHIYLAKSGKHYPVYEWIRSLLDKRQTPVMVILDPDASFLRNSKEDAWINELSKIRPLLNVHVRVKEDRKMDFAKLKEAEMTAPEWMRPPHDAN